MTTLFAEVTPALDPLRLLPISANLLPQEVIDLRRTRKVRAAVAVVLAALLLAVVGWDVQTRQQTASARSDLKQMQQRDLALRNQTAAFAPLVQVQAQAAALGGQLQSLTTGDLPWYKLIPSVRAVAAKYPSTSFGAISGVLNTGVPASATALPSTSASKTIGSLTISCMAPDKSTIAAIVDTLGTVPGLANVYLNSASQATGGAYQCAISADITAAVLGGRFAAPATTATGGK